VTAIAERLCISRAVALSSLAMLEKIGLVEKKGDKWTAVSFDLHLPENSPLNSNNHLNWRVQASQNSLIPDSENIHFTSVYSLSEADFKSLRQKILQLISESREVALSSHQEDAFSFCCDFFRI
jgi:hypothetical protein